MFCSRYQTHSFSSHVRETFVYTWLCARYDVKSLLQNFKKWIIKCLFHVADKQTWRSPVLSAIISSKFYAFYNTGMYLGYVCSWNSYRKKLGVLISFSCFLGKLLTVLDRSLKSLMWFSSSESLYFSCSRSPWLSVKNSSVLGFQIAAKKQT